MSPPRLVAVVVAVVGAVLWSCTSDRPAAEATPARGKDLSVRLGCAACHTTTGAASLGPTWKGLAGSSVRLADGTTVVADRDYLVSSILDPGAQRVAGFNLPMPRIKIDAEDAAAIAAYIESLE